MTRVNRRGLSPAYFSGALSAFAIAALPAAASDFANLSLHDAASGAQIAQPVPYSTTEFPSAPTVNLRIDPADGEVVERVRLSISPDTPDCIITGSSRGDRKDDTTLPFEFEIPGDTTCKFTVTGWDSADNWDGWVGALRDVVIEPKSHQVTQYPITVGTDGVTEMTMGEPGERGAHGVRIYCPVSHFAYDDPIVKPGQPGAAHLHQFIGRIDVDAHTTADTLSTPGRTSCEGGLNIASSYWQPALFNEQDEVVMPESMFIYYKTFMVGITPNLIPEGILNPIPNGFEMLASEDTLNGKPMGVGTLNGKVRMKINFPQCVAVDSNGDPVLRHRDMPGDAANIINSHVAYQTSRDDTENTCPLSHPYRIPQLQIVANYDIDSTSGWYLASDTDRSQPGHSLHADYIAMWDETTMDRIVQCNREARSCGFPGRSQLPERFYSPEGYQIYKYSNVLESFYDRTPFGTSLTPMLP